MMTMDSKNMWCEHYSQLISDKGCVKRQGRITSSRSGRFVDYYCHEYCKGSALIPATEAQLEDHVKMVQRAAKEYGCEISRQRVGRERMRNQAKVNEVVRKGVDEYNVSCLRKRLLKIEPIRRIL